MQHSGQLHLEDIWALLLAAALFIAVRYWRDILGALRLFSDYALHFRVYPSPGITVYPRATSASYVDSDRSGEDENEDAPVVSELIPGLVSSAMRADDTSTSIPNDDLTRPEMLDILARQKVDGKYVFSGNKLADLFANTAHAVSRNVLLAEISAIRSAEHVAPPKRAIGKDTPISAQFRRVEDGRALPETEPASYPVSGRTSSRTHAR